MQLSSLATSINIIAMVYQIAEYFSRPIGLLSYEI